MTDPSGDGRHMPPGSIDFCPGSLGSVVRTGSFRTFGAGKGIDFEAGFFATKNPDLSYSLVAQAVRDSPGWLPLHDLVRG